MGIQNMQKSPVWYTGRGSVQSGVCCPPGTEWGCWCVHQPFW